jgi:cytoskeletal protein RodZ
MKHMEDKIDKLFNDAFEDFEVEPSEASWLSIEKEMNRDKIFKKRMTLVRYAVAASVLVCIFFGVLYITNDTQQNQIANHTNATDSVKQSSDQKKENKVEKIKKQEEKITRPEGSKQVAEVVEIKSKTSVKKPSVKKNTNTINNDTKRISEEEKNAIELLKKNEENTMDKQQKALQQLKIENKAEPTTVASVQHKSDKKEIGSVLDAVNYIAGRISKDEDTKVVAINDKVSADGGKRKSYQVDLGIIKFSRVKHNRD